MSGGTPTALQYKNGFLGQKTRHPSIKVANECCEMHLQPTCKLFHSQGIYRHVIADNKIDISHQQQFAVCADEHTLFVAQNTPLLTSMD